MFNDLYSSIFPIQLSIHYSYISFCIPPGGNNNNIIMYGSCFVFRKKKKNYSFIIINKINIDRKMSAIYIYTNSCTYIYIKT